MHTDFDSSPDSADSAYGHVTRLLDRNLGTGVESGGGPGLVLDLGEHLIDLDDVDGLSSRLDDVAAGRRVAAVTALDLLQHLARPDLTLRALRDWMTARDVPALALSVPNVGHVDVAAKLLAGRWDVTPTGLLGETHLRFFTDRSLNAMMSGTGFTEVARDDVQLAFSDQAWPPDHPTQSPDSMLGMHLRTLRKSADEHAETNQFVRIYAPTGAAPAEDTPHSALAVEPVTDRRSPFLSVITRTTGSRTTLLDTLACLSGQTDADFEILLMVNTDDSADRDAVLDLIGSFDSSFRARVRVDVSTEMHRVAPLNRALDLARGRYITVLDDDDFVFGDWVEQFHRAAATSPGAVVRCRAVDQRIDTVGSDGPAVAASGFEAAYRETFDLASHFAGGQSPPATFAVPSEALDTFNLRFDEEMIVCEDIEFYLRAASICGVVDTRTFGMVYRRWTDRFASQHTVAPEVWENALQEVVRRLDARPLLMPPGTASRLYQAAVQERQLYDLDHGTSALLRRLAMTERNWADLVHSYAHLEQDYLIVKEERDRLQDQAATGQDSLPRRVIRRGRRTLRERS